MSSPVRVPVFQPGQPVSLPAIAGAFHRTSLCPHSTGSYFVGFFSLVAVILVAVASSLGSIAIEGTERNAPVLKLAASHLIERHENVLIDWTSRTIYAVGFCDALRKKEEPHCLASAYSGAKRSLIKALTGLAVTSFLTVDDLCARCPSLFFLIHSLVDNAQVFAQGVERERGIAGVMLALNLSESGAVPLLVEGMDIGQYQSSLPKPTPPQTDANAKLLAEIRQPTGLIIDARNVCASQAILPAIYAEDGRLVFGRRFARRLRFMQHGLCSYVSDLETAGRDGKLGVNPKVVEAASASGPCGCDLIVSDDDADRLIFLRTRLPFFSECRLTIVCSSNAPIEHVVAD